jgi:hypothetical protein
VSAPAEDLLSGAKRVLADGLGSTTGVWPRACALLTRQALECAIDDYWAGTEYPEFAGASGRSKLTCLVVVAGADAAGPVAAAWSELSNACHVHAYRLAPTAGELARWIDVVSDFSRLASP